jgi:hypothetical protein
VVIAGKRKQRIIPIIAPLKNTSMEFVETIGLLYYNQSNHLNLANKKIQYLMEHIRSHFFLQTDILDEIFFEQLADKSKLSIETIRGIFKQIRSIQNTRKLSEKELLDFNQNIEQLL